MNTEVSSRISSTESDSRREGVGSFDRHEGADLLGCGRTCVERTIPFRPGTREDSHSPRPSDGPIRRQRLRFLQARANREVDPAAQLLRLRYPQPPQRRAAPTDRGPPRSR